jgi:predicted N-acetyltransferase YhbS
VIIRPDGAKTDTVTFGPLSVLPRFHKQGIGSALVHRSLEEARTMGIGGVLIAGVPDYYPKLGFHRAREYGLTLEDGSSGDPFMAYELIPGYLSGGGVLKFLPPEFEQCEKDNVGFDAFHKSFLQQTSK